MRRPVILLIMDGWGVVAQNQGNAISQANTPNYDRFMDTYPHTHLLASGEAVGLPLHEVGNTETGHLNMGAGHIVYQDLPRINMAIADGSFFSNEKFLEAIKHAQSHNSSLHIMGLLGAGGVHANNEHLLALIAICKERGFTNVNFHSFTDGRDSPPTAAMNYLKDLHEELSRVKLGHIASVMGRYYAMDRDERWERTGLAYDTLVHGKGPIYASYVDVINESYAKSITDEFIKPSLIKDSKGQVHTVADNDAVIFYNYRIDRPRQLTKAFVYEEFEDEMYHGSALDSSALRYVKRAVTKLAGKGSQYSRGEMLKNLYFVTMTEYEKNLPVHIAFPPVMIVNPLGRILADDSLRQLRLAESEKERFVTFYFNGQREMPFVGEDRIILKSLEVATYDLAPQMKTREIVATLQRKLSEDMYDCYIVNLACPDMVGHTGVLSAAIRAVEIVDECLGTLEQAIHQNNACMFITADHGNCEEMINLKTGGTNTEHSANPVPFIVISKHFAGKKVRLPPGILADIAPTILSYMDMEIPFEMTGRNLLTSVPLD
jgi:2,3-bisphosphoglycerate-independent phosphoglycerate mutase